MMIEAWPVPLDLGNVRLRAGDEAECRVDNLSPAQAVRQSVELSQHSWMVTVDGRPAAYWGYSVEGFMTPVVNAWLLTTPEVERVRRRFARISRRVVDYLLTIAPVVAVHTYPDYRLACRWLQWLGFTPYGAALPNGLQVMIRRR